VAEVVEAATQRLHLAAALLQILELQVALEAHLTVQLADRVTTLEQFMHTMTQRREGQQDSLALSQVRLDLLEELQAAVVVVAEADTQSGTMVEVLDRTTVAQEALEALVK